MSEQAAYAFEDAMPAGKPASDTVSVEFLDSIALDYLIEGSALDPVMHSPHREFVRSPTTFPQDLDASDVFKLGARISQRVQQTHPTHLPGSREAVKQAGHLIGRSIAWLGELAAHNQHPTTTWSAIAELRNRGGLANRRRAKKLEKLLHTLSD